MEVIGYAFMVVGAAVETVLAYQLLTTIAVSALLSTVSSKLFGPKAPKNVLTGVQVMGRSALEYRKVVYGKAMVSGPVFYNNTSGTNNEYLWYGVALCDGESEDILSIWFDGDEIPQADIAWTPGTGGSDGAGTGVVSTTKWIGDNSVNSVKIFYYLGDDDQPVCGELDSAFADVGTNHRLRGITHVVCSLLYNADTEEVWSSGTPNNIKAVVQGRKIYDPRLDTTQIIDAGTSPVTYGSGAHRTTDSSTWEWSDNPALCVADYLTQIMGVATTSVNWSSIAGAADDCDVSVAIANTSPLTMETRFTCNGALSLGSSHKDNLDSLISSMAGRLSYSGGTWKLRASVWEASSVTLTAADLAGDVEVRGSAPKSERFNGVRGFFVDPERNYEAAEFPHITNSTYVTRDNGKTILYDLQLPMTNTDTMAQRIAYRNLEQGNNQVFCKLTLNATGAKIAVGDVVSVTLDDFSWSAKTFRCVEWSRNPDGTFAVTLREDVEADYDDPATGSYGTAGNSAVTVPSTVVPPPTGFSATSIPYGVKLSWTNPAVSEFDFIDVYASATSAWSGASLIASVRTSTYTHGIGSGTTRYYWLRARRNSGDVSTRIPDSDTSTIVGTSGAGTDSVSLTGATLSDELVTTNDAEVSYRIASTGEEQSYEGDGGTHADISDWLLSGAAGDYDVRLTVNSGTNPTGSSLATWLDAGTTRTWTLTDSVAGGGAIVNNCTVELRDGTSLDVLASATVTMSVDKQAPAVTLSGTSGSPNTALSTSTSAGWRFNSDGTVDRKRASYAQFASSTQWIIPNSPSATYYIRATANAGDNPDTGTIGSWEALTSDRTWLWTTAENSGSVKIEIAEDAGGVTIVATGYYGGFYTAL